MNPLKGIRSIEDINLEGRRVFIRLDLNYPLGQNGKIMDESKIHAALPTIRYAIENGAKLILAGHVGQPKGKKVADLSMIRVGQRLAEILDKEIYLPDELFGDGPKKVIMERTEGEIVLLENLRFHGGEDNNEEAFAIKLADLADVYINDCFASASKQMASTHAITKYVMEKGAGFLFLKELNALSKILSGPEQPFMLVVGGLHFSDKIGYLLNLLSKAKVIAFGGLVSALLLAVQGYNVGKTKIESEKIEIAQNFLTRAKLKGVDILLPTDVVVADEISEEGAFVVGVDSIPSNVMILDIGPETAQMYASRVNSAKTVLWNGTMGVCEDGQFMTGTEMVAKAIARSSAMGIVIGEDTSYIVGKLVLTPFFKHVSLAGHTALEFLEGREMPSLQALRVLDDDIRKG